MTVPHNLARYQRLGEGIKNRAVFDDPKMNPREIFAKLAVDFNNDDIIVSLPLNSSDVEGWETMNPNDTTRSRIHRDRKSNIIYLVSHS